MVFPAWQAPVRVGAIRTGIVGLSRPIKGFQGLLLFSILPLLVGQIAEALLPPPHALRAGGHGVWLRLAVYRPLPSEGLRAGRSQSAKPLSDFDLRPQVAWKVVTVTYQFVGKVLLGDVVSIEVVWVLVTASA